MTKLKPARRSFLYRCEMVYIALDFTFCWFRCPKGHVFQDTFTTGPDKRPMSPTGIKFFTRYWGPPSAGQGRGGVNVGCPTCEHELGFKCKRRKLIRREAAGDPRLNVPFRRAS